MKKLIFIILLIFLAGCSKDEAIIKTTYQIRNDLPQMLSNYAWFGLHDLEVKCYSGKCIIRIDTIEFIKSGGGMSEKMEIPNSVDTVKFEMRLLLGAELFDTFHIIMREKIEIGKNNLITIDL